MTQEFLKLLLVLQKALGGLQSFMSFVNEMSQKLTGVSIFDGLNVTALDTAISSLNTVEEAIVAGGSAAVQTANDLQGLSNNATKAKPSLSALQKQVAEFLKTLGQSKKPKEDDAKATKDQAKAERDRREGLKKLQQAQAQVSTRSNQPARGRAAATTPRDHQRAENIHR